MATRWSRGHCGLGLLAVWLPAAGASPQQIVTSNGLSVTMPASWHIEPYPKYAMCAAPFPVVHTGLPADAVFYGSCPLLRPSETEQPMIDMGTLDTRQLVPLGPVTRIGPLSVVVLVGHGADSSLGPGFYNVTAIVPRLRAQLMIYTPNLAQAYRIVHSIRPARLGAPGNQ